MSASAAICVCVLEGNYARMTELGVPLSLAVKLQSHNLRLDSLLWIVRSSSGSYSVSFFWPSLQRKQRCSRWQRKPQNSYPATSTTHLSGTILPRESHFSNMSGPAPGNHSRSVPLTPSNAHLGKKGSETRAASTAATASKESDQDPPHRNESVSSTEENTHESGPPGQSTGSDSLGEQHIDLKACTDVKYEKRGGVHGVVV